MKNTKQSPCKDCYYSWLANSFDGGEQIWSCCYILIEHRRRPCPYGAGCTEHKPKNWKKKHTEGWFRNG